MGVNFCGWTGSTYSDSFLNQGTKDYAKSKGVDDITTSVSASDLEGLASHWDDITQKGVNGANSNNLQDALLQGKFQCDSSAERAAILCLCNPKLLNDLDGSDHNSIFTKEDFDRVIDEIKKNGPIKPDKTPSDNPPEKPSNPIDAVHDADRNAGILNNDPSVTFMDKFEAAVKGDKLDGRATNGKFGSLGLWGLAKLHDHSELLDPNQSYDDMMKSIDKFIDDPAMSANVTTDPVKRGLAKSELAQIITEFRTSGKPGEPAMWAGAAQSLSNDINDPVASKDLFGDDGAASMDDLNRMDFQYRLGSHLFG